MVLRPKGHAARIGLRIWSLATLSRPVTLTFQWFAYFGTRHLFSALLRHVRCTVL
jgi:hypothetical protein